MTTNKLQRSFAVSGPIPWNSLTPTRAWPPLTHTQFCTLVKTMLRVYGTPPQHLHESSESKNCCTFNHLLSYLLNTLAAT